MIPNGKRKRSHSWISLEYSFTYGMNEKTILRLNQMGTTGLFPLVTTPPQPGHGGNSDSGSSGFFTFRQSFRLGMPSLAFVMSGPEMDSSNSSTDCPFHPGGGLENMGSFARNIC